MKLDEISIDDLRQLNKLHGMSWFEEREKEMFKSSHPKTAQIHREYAYFVSGEQYERRPRRYTIRRANLETGDIDKIDNFQKYSARHYAKIGIENIINTIELNMTDTQDQR